MFVTQEDPNLNDRVFTSLEPNESVSCQFHQCFYFELRQLLNKGELLPFEVDHDGNIIRTSELGAQIVVPDSLKQGLLYTNNYAN